MEIALRSMLGILPVMALAATMAAPFPRTVTPGKRLPELEALFAQDCARTEVMHYTGEEAAPFTRQTQVNCHGLDVLGARRKVEFMFNDGPLGHVWIHIAADEAPAIRRVLEEAFGPVVFSTGQDQVFASGTVALRASPPEVLVATPELITDLTGYKKPAPPTGLR